MKETKQLPQRCSRPSTAVLNHKSRSHSRLHQGSLIPWVCGGAQGTELIINSAYDCKARFEATEEGTKKEEGAMLNLRHEDVP